METSRKLLTDELRNDGYKLFMQTAVGSVIHAEAWVSKPERRPMVIVLFRRDTGEAVDPNQIPDDEKKRADVFAFLNDFRRSRFLHQPSVFG